MMSENKEMLKKHMGTHQKGMEADLKDFQWPNVGQIKQKVIQTTTKNLKLFELQLR